MNSINEWFQLHTLHNTRHCLGEIGWKEKEIGILKQKKKLKRWDEKIIQPDFFFFLSFFLYRKLKYAHDHSFTHINQI